MKTTSIIPIAVLAASSSVWADTATTTSTSSTAASGSTDTACAALSILDACLDTTESYLSLCESTDYSCLCDKYTTIMTCFANCPNDDRQYALDSEKQLYCSNASAFSTKTTTSSKPTSASTTTSESTSADATDGATTTYGDGDATKTAGSSSSETSLSAAGAEGSVFEKRGAAGLLAAFAGVVVALL
ncbi:hypothetical protein F5Y07DRAFT_407630 [Xylaria sp. FL0933]|nr:hypothetical protein F5Y07DRAFT_407630 [Xylaria sp. FL0933]